MDSVLNFIMFAVDTTFIHSDSDLIKVVSHIKLNFENIKSLIKIHNNFKKWSKT